MDTLRLGQSDLSVSRLGVGAMTWGAPTGLARLNPAKLVYGGAQGRDEEQAAFEASVEAGHRRERKLGSPRRRLSADDDRCALEENDGRYAVELGGVCEHEARTQMGRGRPARLAGHRARLVPIVGLVKAYHHVTLAYSAPRLCGSFQSLGRAVAAAEFPVRGFIR